MSWVKSLDIIGIFIALSVLIYVSIEGIELKLAIFSFFDFIILLLETAISIKTRGLVTVSFYFFICSYFFSHSNFLLEPGSIESINLFVINPIVFLILGIKHKNSRSSLITFLFVCLLFSTYGSDFWNFVKKSPNKDVIKRQAFNEKHKNCKHKPDQNLGYNREENCNSHNIIYYLNGEKLSRFVLNTNFRGDRLVPDSNLNSNHHAFFIGGSRTFGDGVSDMETYPNYLSQLLNLNSRIWANSAWGLNQASFLIHDRWKELYEASQNGQVTVFYHAIASHITRTSGGYYETMRYHKNYPKYLVSNDKLNYLGTLRGYSFSKLIAYSWVWNFCRLECKLTFRLGASVSDYLMHLDFISNKLEKIENSNFVIIIHPGRYGHELKNEVDLASHFSSNPNVTVIDASNLFALKTPYVIHEHLDNHLSSKGNKVLANFISLELQKIYEVTKFK
jgi:hypothetical protein